MSKEAQVPWYRPEVGSSRVEFGAIDSPRAASGPTVLQVVRTYLPKTENWIYEQVRHVERYRSVFAAKAITNTGTFPFRPLYALSQSSIAARLLDRTFKRRVGYSPYFSSLALSENARIIHAHGGGIATFLASSARRLRLPLVVSFYGVDMWKHPDGEAGLRSKYAEVFPLGARFLAEGPAAARQLTRIGCPADRITIHRLGVDVNSIQFVPRSLSNGAALKVLMASRFVEKKGIPYAVEGFCRVARDNPSMQLTIVGDSGSAKDARIRDEITRIVRAHAVSDQVSVVAFMGRDALSDLARQHHILLHPSVKAADGDSEGGHPVVMTMLAASGMPILATRHCDIPEIVEHKQNGWLVSERSSDEIEATLREIVRDPSCFEAFGRHGRKLAELNYDIRNMRLDGVYDGVMAENG